MDADKQKVLVDLGSDNRLAHAVLFRHRHPDATPSFHYDFMDLFHSAAPEALLMGFRGSGKSTTAEEGTIKKALFREFRNGLIVGASEQRAVERLRAMRHEFETNTAVEYLFGNVQGDTWAETRLRLSNGVFLQAYGRGQSLRGAKDLAQRPDFVLLDDVEDEESVATAASRDKTMSWMLSVLQPSLDPNHLMRMTATPLHPEALAVRLMRIWPHVSVPVESLDPASGLPVPTWPERFPAAWIEREKKAYYATGRGDLWQQEYMMQVEDPATKPFTSTMLTPAIVVPRTHAWEATWAMIDPARTVNARSAHTGLVVWSWVGSKLVVWEAEGGFWKPDEIVEKIFQVNRLWRPVAIGVEEDGLHEFIMQPLRQAQAVRGELLPLKAMKAPVGKDGFIRGLQPFFKAGEVTFAKPLPALVEQLLSFPSGRKDIPNALAYALTLRPGQPVYEDFSAENVTVAGTLGPAARLFFGVDATRSETAAVLVEATGEAVRVIWDGVHEGPPGAGLATLVRDARATMSGYARTPVFVAPPRHWRPYDLIGLLPAARAIPLDLRQGGEVSVGEEEVRRLLRLRTRGFPALQIQNDARWTLNALAGGYARAVDKSGRVKGEIAPGPYACLMNALASVVAQLAVPSLEEEDNMNYRWSERSGRNYLSSLPQRR